MRGMLFQYATPLTAGLFLVSTVSGVALFFGWQPAMFHEMHEVLSLVLLLPVVVHLWRNWRPLVLYFRHAAMPIALALSLAAGGYYALAAGGQSRGGNPAFALMASAQRAPLADLAPVLKLDAEGAVQRLQAAGFGPVAPTDTVADIAARNGVEVFAVMSRLTAAPTP